jgi:hypothetical protein
LQQQFSQGLAYLNQNGIPQWDASTEYVTGSIVRVGTLGRVYVALQGNTGRNPASDNAKFPRVYWEMVSGGQVQGSYAAILVQSSGPYTPDPAVRGLRFTVVGGGGGGGGCSATGAGEAATAVAGGAGATCIKSLGKSAPTEIDYQNGYVLTIGAGGSGGVGNGAPSSGGQSTLTGAGVNMVAGGGTAGTSDTSSSGSVVRPGVNGGNSSGGDLNLVGAPSEPCIRINGSRTQIGNNGWSYAGLGRRRHLADSNGSSGELGSGGSGTSSSPGNGPFTGGDGGDGFILIEEFY